MVDFRIDVVVDPRRAKPGIDAVDKGLDRLDRKASGLGSTLGRAIGLLGGAAIGIGAIRNLALYEQALARAAATAEASSDEFERFRDVTQELGASTRFTALQATEGLQFLAQAGFSASDSVEVLDETLLLAQVGLLDIGRAADIVTNIMAAFRAPVEEAGHFVDVLARTATASNTNISQLGDAIKFVGPVAKGTGVSIEEMAAAIGVLSNAGLQATLAGTSLRRTISELERPSRKTSSILKDLGVAEEEVKVSTVGLIPALRRLAEAGLNVGEALAIFGQRGGPGAEVLTNTIVTVEELNEVLQKAGGFATTAAKRIDDNLLGSLLRVKSAFEAVILAVGREGGTGGLRGLLEGLTTGLRSVAANADLVVQVVKNLALFLGPRFLLGAVRALTVAIAANPVGLLLVALSTAIALVPEFQQALNDVVGTIKELSSEIASGIDFSPLILGAAETVDGVLTFFSALGESIGFVFDQLPAKQKEVGELLKKGFRDTVEAIIDYFLALNQTVGNILIGIGSDAISVLENVGGVAGALSTGSLDAANAFKENIESALSRSANRLTTFVNQFQGNLTKLRDTEFLPEVEVSESARDLGAQVGQQFSAALEQNITVTQDLARDLLNPAEIEQAAEQVEDALKGIGEEQAALAEQSQLNVDRIAADLSQEAQRLREQIDLRRQLRDEAILLQEIEAAGVLTAEDLARAYDDFALRALESSNALEDGFTRAFIKIRQEAEDFASVAEAAVGVVADNLTDALVEFAETGKISFRELASSIVSDLIRIIARLLVVQALSAVFGGGGGAAAGIASNLASSSLQSSRAKGGMVQPGQNVLVGEKGPEIMRVGRTAFVEPNGGGQSAPPEVNVQVVNVDDPKMVTGAIASGSADDVILNVLTRNRDKVRRTIS